MRTVCGTILAGLSLCCSVVFGSAEEVVVQVRQTPAGPRIFVDGKAVRPRFFYGSPPCLSPISMMQKHELIVPFRADEEYTDWAGVYLFERIEDVYPDMEEYRQACVAIKKQHAELITRLQHLLGEYYKKNIDAGTFERVISYNVSER